MALVVRLRGMVLALAAAASLLPAAELACRLARPTGVTGSPVEDAVTLVLVAVLLLCWTWLAVVALLVGAETSLRRRSRSLRLAPRVVRVALAAACGVGLTGTASALATPLGSAGAADHLVDHPGGTGRTSAAPLDGLAVPDRAPGAGPRPSSRPPATTPLHAPAGRTMVVRHGDSLWAITQRLQGDACFAELDAGWRALYAANRAVVGADPDLLQPGMRLVVPHRLLPRHPDNRTQDKTRPSEDR